jgi:hypothetical protein
MRVNAEEHGDMYEVYLDGKKLTSCIEADDIEGWARCFKRGNDGRFILTEDLQEIETEILTGEITIVDTDVK